MGVPSTVHRPLPSAAAPLLEGVQGVAESVSPSLLGRHRERVGVVSQRAAQGTPLAVSYLLRGPLPQTPETSSKPRYEWVCFQEWWSPVCSLGSGGREG